MADAPKNCTIKGPFHIILEATGVKICHNIILTRNVCSRKPNIPLLRPVPNKLSVEITTN